MKITVHYTINSNAYDLEVDAGETLLEALRNRLKLTSVHRSCEEGECGACTVLMDGEPVNSCLMLAAAADGAEILTPEGLMKGERRHPIMDAFVDLHGMQCGFCTPGLLMTGYSLIQKANGGELDEATIRQSIEGNLCRCTGYMNIVKAIQEAKRRKDAGDWW